MTEIVCIYPRLFSFLSQLQKIDFILYHEAIRSKDYVKFFKQSKNYKMMDSSYYELRRAVDYKHMIKLGKEMKINEIILPDKLWDGDWTRKSVEKNLEKFHGVYVRNKWKIAGVIQGKDINDIFETIMFYRKDPRINVWMLPRKMLLYETYSLGRLKVWLDFQIYFKEFVESGGEIHFLGANSWGDLFPPNSKLIRSVDSKLLVKSVSKGWKWEKWEDRCKEYVNNEFVCQAVEDILHNYYKEV